LTILDFGLSSHDQFGDKPTVDFGLAILGFGLRILDLGKLIYNPSFLSKIRRTSGKFF